jgi:dTDP-4-dehydrorhamnose 3,5-epimerase-like enzyme
MTILQPYELRPQSRTDPRGTCTYLDPLPFLAQRYFYLSECPRNAIRGDHQHKSCWQALHCVTGRATLQTTGVVNRVWDLCRESIVVVPPFYGIRLLNFSEGCVVCVLASEPYSLNEFVSAN